ncbi:MAG: diaminopimelate decarboxylase [Firmicutes bacterium]|nr:diaminopimelate decarboxylase [Bacillota bacterium]
MKKPFVSSEQLEKIIQKFPTPFHLYDEAGIRKNARRLLKAFSWNTGFCEYFAVKANPNPSLLKILKEEGCGVDCSSLTELMLAQSCGFSGDEIMFSSNATPAQDFIYAHKLNALINLDDITHIDFLEKCIGKLPQKICLRYNPGSDFNIRSQIMDTPKDAKYGFTKPQLLQGIKMLQTKGVTQFGLHAFLSSNSLESAYYPALAEKLFETAVWLKGETGAAIGFINLSGGIGIPYKPEDNPIDIQDVSLGVQEAYNRILTANGLDGVRICTELGRYMTGPYGALIATAIHKKDIYKSYVGLDACAVNLMRPAMYGAYHHITVIGKENAPHDKLYDITGGLCENNDKFALDRALPAIETGNRIFIHDTGAHGYAMGYNYNGKLRSAEVLLQEDGSAKLIRRAETPEDYFATLKF